VHGNASGKLILNTIEQPVSNGLNMKLHDPNYLLTYAHVKSRSNTRIKKAVAHVPSDDGDGASRALLWTA
jgi:hypothetical protein